MGRLDLYLVDKKLIPTRSRAKRAIICGLIKVNGEIEKKPSHKVKEGDVIEILSEIATKPVGYWKLHAIYNLLGFELINSKDIVLDLGSSAGGFLEFAAQRCQKVYGIEISDQFAHILYQLKQKYPNISVLLADVYEFDPQQNPIIEQIDLILNDLTLEPVESLKILFKFLPLLKKRGYLIISIKLGTHSSKECLKYIEKKFARADLSISKVMNIDPDKKEIHILAQKQ